MLNARVIRHTSRALVVCMLGLLLPMQTLHAGLVPTHEVAGTVHAQPDRERVTAFLQREDVRHILSRQGLSADDAAARVQAMTDQEVRQLAERIDSLPAGAGILGFVFAVFVILLITDILGFTKVFPFTRSIQ